MKTCLALLGLVAVLVAVDCASLAETKRHPHPGPSQQQSMDSHELDSSEEDHTAEEYHIHPADGINLLVHISGGLVQFVRNLKALKDVIEEFGGVGELEQFFANIEGNLEPFLFNESSPPSAPSGSPPAAGSPPSPTGLPSGTTLSVRSLKRILDELMKSKINKK